MKTKRNSLHSKDKFSDEINGFHFHTLEIHRLRFLNNRVINILSRVLISLFMDFYPSVKH